ncbi:MAG: glycogen synthase GlgA [Nitrospirae bacterium]|nr:glycogen synthase GlgA [Nitrospirota bacterium]
MKILIAASEAVPYVKTGGLADVTGTLVNEYKKLGTDAAIILPLYRKIKRSAGALGLKSTGKEISVSLAGRPEKGIIWERKTPEGAIAYFIENDKWYDRDELYGTAGGDYPDNIARFSFFCRAICETLKILGLSFDVIHCNDWQTGLIPVYLKTLYKKEFAKTASLITIHNIGYQGLFASSDMPFTGLGPDLFSIDGLEFYGKINLLKGGILYADIINTVSSNYAREILTEEYGFGLQGVLGKRIKDLYGIINGIDYHEWDPESDALIQKNYSLKDMSGKEDCRKALQKACSLPSTKAMIIGMVTRLSAQKGIDITARAMQGIIKSGAQVIILGKGDEPFHKIFLNLKKKYSDQMSVTIGFDDALAHKIYAGSDVFLMPSQYEPCGLGQLIALRYGTIPIGRKTGGLADTINDYSHSGKSGTGFLFNGYSSNELLAAVKRAHELFGEDKAWMKIQKNAMSQNFSWQRSAEEYLLLFQKAAGKMY